MTAERKSFSYSSGEKLLVRESLVFSGCNKVVVQLIFGVFGFPCLVVNRGGGEDE